MINRNGENDRNDENVNAIQELRELYTTLCSWQKKKYDNLRSKDQKLFDNTFIIVGLVFFVNVTINFSYLVNEDEDLMSIQLDVQCHVQCSMNWDYGKST
ncbi:hypothetical protein F8M41_005375 [Gigaspora margarita]|uniref:Uncharacterized protein n=1 Tax=Gigaspora margarita TaxID=4874 RepID=A0A8H4A4P9_GIGMA|nr:hypothetical protein F8M41_005375 [Gigaspora margarita]